MEIPTRLVMPFRINAATTAAAKAGPETRSWIQLATTGSFTSSRYGKFEISPAALKEMAANFTTLNGAGRTVIDYDHLTSDKPVVATAAQAAGWLHRVEVRNGGKTLWGLASWTPMAAEMIRDGRYRFISPSYSSNYVDSHTGKQIGYALLSAALTNTPFLRNMESVSLAADPVFEAYAEVGFPTAVRLTGSPPEVDPLDTGGRTASAGLPATTADPHSRAGTLVSFDPLNEHAVAELTPEERAATYRVVGVSDGTFVQIVTESGDAMGWYPENVFVPARAKTPPIEKTVGPDGKTPGPEDVPLVDDVTDAPVPPKAAKAAKKFAADVQALIAAGQSARDAVLTLAARDAEGAESYRLHYDALAPEAATVSLSRGQSFDDLVREHATLHKVSLATAVRIVANLHPDLAQAR